MPPSVALPDALPLTVSLNAECRMPNAECRLLLPFKMSARRIRHRCVPTS